MGLGEHLSQNDAVGGLQAGIDELDVAAMVRSKGSQSARAQLRSVGDLWRTIRKTSGEANMGNGEANMGNGEANMGNGEANMGNGEANMGNGEANMGNGEANMGNGEANMGFNPLYGNLRFHDWFHDELNKREQRIDDDWHMWNILRSDFFLGDCLRWLRFF